MEIGTKSVLEVNCFGHVKQFIVGDVVIINTDNNGDITGRITFIDMGDVEIDCSERFYSNIVNVKYENIVNISLVEEEQN